MFPAFPAEMILILRLKTGILPVLIGSYQVRSVMFTTGWFPLKNDQFMSTACRQVEYWYSYSVGQDGKCNRQAVEIHDRKVSR